jgi:hypothetical protein
MQKNPVLGFRPKPEIIRKLEYLSIITKRRKGAILELLIEAATLGPDGSLSVHFPVQDPENGSAPEEPTPSALCLLSRPSDGE